ncbi:MAG TPA: toxin C-terminal domain-containing protein [Candidatus Babeliales bacterium]|nr:toxin C-terminal domain-containing protein [Candidatus Babeliales bacterium]
MVCSALNSATQIPHAVANNIANLTKNVTLGLVKTMVLLLDFDPEYVELKSHVSALHDYGSERYQQFWDYVETVPRLQKFEQVGEFVGEQILSLAVNFLTGKAVSVISDSVIAAQLHKAMTVKKQADKAKPGKISWLNKFGAPGKDVARTLGLVVAEEYELAELNGLVISFKSGSTNNQTLFNHAEDYLKHNQSGKKSKCVSGAVKPAPNEIKPARIMGPQMSLLEKKLLAKELAKKMGFRKTNYYSQDLPVYQRGNRFITIDRNDHNGGFWKMADSVKNLESKAARLGTYDKNLNRIGD